MVNHQDKLVLRKEDWLVGRPECSPLTLKPPQASFLADGSKVYLSPYTLTAETGSEFYDIAKREGDPNSEAYPIENAAPVF